MRQKTRAKVAAARPSGGAGGAAATPTARSSSSAAPTSKPTAMQQVSAASDRLQVESAPFVHEIRLSIPPVLVITTEEISGVPSATGPEKSNSCHNLDQNSPKGIFDLTLHFQLI